MGEFCPNPQAPGPCPPGSSGAPLPSHPAAWGPPGPPRPSASACLQSGCDDGRPGGCSPPTALKVTVSPNLPTRSLPQTHTQRSEVAGSCGSHCGPHPPPPSGGSGASAGLARGEAGSGASCPPALGRGGERVDMTVLGTHAIGWVVNRPEHHTAAGAAGIQHRPETSFLRFRERGSVCRASPGTPGRPPSAGGALPPRLAPKAATVQPAHRAGSMGCAPPLGPGSRLPRFQAPSR